MRANTEHKTYCHNPYPAHGNTKDNTPPFAASHKFKLLAGPIKTQQVVIHEFLDLAVPATHASPARLLSPNLVFAMVSHEHEGAPVVALDPVFDQGADASVNLLANHASFSHTPAPVSHLAQILVFGTHAHHLTQLRHSSRQSKSHYPSIVL